MINNWINKLDNLMEGTKTLIKSFDNLFGLEVGEKTLLNLKTDEKITSKEILRYTQQDRRILLILMKTREYINTVVFLRK